MREVDRSIDRESAGENAGRSEPMHPYWVLYFVFLGVFFIVALLLTLGRGLWAPFLLTSAVIGLAAGWGWWRSKLCSSSQRVELTEDLPSDPDVRLAALERIQASGLDRGLPRLVHRVFLGVMVLLCGVGIMDWILEGISLGPLVGVAVYAGGMMIFMVAIRLFAPSFERALMTAFSPPRSPHGVRSVERGVSDEQSEDEVREVLLSWTPRAIHTRRLLRVFASAAVPIFALVAIMVVLDFLVGLGVVASSTLDDWESAYSAMTSVVMVLWFVLLGFNSTPRARRASLRRSNELLYGDAEGGSRAMSGREEMDEIVRRHREGRRES